MHYANNGGYHPGSLSRYYLSKDLFKTGNFIGMAFLILNAISLAVSFGIIFAGEFWGRANGQENAALSLLSGDASWILQFFLSAVMFTVPFVLTAKALKYKVGDIVPFNKVAPGMFVILVIMMLGMAMAGNYATNWFGTILEDTLGIQPLSPDFSAPAGFFSKGIFIIAISFIPAFVEEFALRGVVLGSLRKFGDLFAVFVSALLFGIMHGNLIQAPFAFIMGIGLGLSVVISNSLWPAIVAHFINNFASAVLTLIQPEIPQDLYVLISIFYVLLFALAGLIAFVYVIRKYEGKLKVNSPHMEIASVGKFGRVIGSPALIISLLFYALNIVLMLDFTGLLDQFSIY